MTAPAATSAATRPVWAQRIAWRPLLAGTVLAIVLTLLIRSDWRQVEWAKELSSQGSAAPARDPTSPTGYVLGQRHFLGTHERGETYRWIAMAQEILATHRTAPAAYAADNVPEGRPRLLPNLYAAWIAGIAQAIHLTTDAPAGICVERAALWEPLISHVFAFIALVGFMWARVGAGGAVMAALVFALFPLFSAQFLPGVLTPRTWALLLAAYSLAAALWPARGEKEVAAPGLRSGVAAGLALWLDPAIGFPAVLITSALGFVAPRGETRPFPHARWAVVGAVIVVLAWFIDANPWDVKAGELRYVHPYYGAAWLGLAIVLDVRRRVLVSQPRWRWVVVEGMLSLALIAPLGWTQFTNGYRGWLYPSAALRRLTSLDETAVYNTGFDWLGRASFAEVVLVALPVLFGLGAGGWALRRGPAKPPRALAVATLVVLAGLLLAAFFRMRWTVVVCLVALPAGWQLATALPSAARRVLSAASVVYVIALVAWAQAPTVPFRQPTAGATASSADVAALVNRHFAHWLASHRPGRNPVVLTSPDLSDSIVFHGGNRTLLSTAWESYRGQVAASRVLSAPEASEAEAVLQSREITHVVLPSWDRILPLLVQKPATADRDTLYDRLQRWVLPPYLRAIPYRLPPVPGYAGEKLAVFAVTPPQDEALSLSRLAEYFVEMGRDEPATLAAKVLLESSPDDPNAVLARATVYAQIRRPADFQREMRLAAADATAGRSPFSWDRRVQRAILLALDHRLELARTEVAACLATGSRDDLFELTPLQAHRLQILATRFNCPLPDAEIARLLTALGAEYAASPASNPGR